MKAVISRVRVTGAADIRIYQSKRSLRKEASASWVSTKMSIPVGMETEALRKLVLENEEVLPWVEGKNIVKFIAVRNIVNIVVK